MLWQTSPFPVALQLYQLAGRRGPAPYLGSYFVLTYRAAPLPDKTGLQRLQRSLLGHFLPSLWVVVGGPIGKNFNHPKTFTKDGKLMIGHLVGFNSPEEEVVKRVVDPTTAFLQRSRLFSSLRLEGFRAL